MATITEALAEIKTIGARLAKKREFVGGYLARQDNVKDPLAKDGGSPAALAAERQAIHDLEERIVALRRGIRAANEATLVTIVGETRTISDWLVWRREVAQGQKDFVMRMRAALSVTRAQALQKGVGVRSADQTVGQPNDLIVNVDERLLATEAEQIEEILGTLDGLLSLKNATVTIAY